MCSPSSRAKLLCGTVRVRLTTLWRPAHAEGAKDFAEENHVTAVVTYCDRYSSKRELKERFDRAGEVEK